ncbi:MAG: MBL fold metallo-hydrolase [Bacteroidota bacterium]|nr:MBL fold metallo-hydrolase [Bacteroidota bacterium]MEC8033130.1 MBL fold metallo-hydrolase [Bacteroidota bacterium]MEC8757364.1 MBL fold metallo-hydrolase [Bacteroidota bacterium]
MNLHVIDTGHFKLDGGAMFGVVPKALWNRHQPADENNRCTWAMRCLLIEAHGRVILIDTGMGNKQDDKFRSHFEPHGEGDLLASIARAGYTREEITDVVLTHLHFDHCGGAVQKRPNGDLELTFPNAIHWSEENHWKWATDPNPRERASFLKENILPIKESGMLKFVNDDTEIIPELWFAIADGHTHGMLIPHLEIGEETLVFMADLLPSPTHIPLAWVMGYDIDPLQTIREKEAFLAEAAENNFILFYEHDPVIECSRVVQTVKGFRASDTMSLADILRVED